MGLLDEAIREHLDLRRRHGADPGEVAREELDALAPVEVEPAQRSMPDNAENEASGEAGWRAPFDDRPEQIVGADRRGRGESWLPENSFMEETAEIDMRTILGEIEDAMSREEAHGDAHVQRAIRVESNSGHDPQFARGA